MTKSPITLQELRRRIYVKAKVEKPWRFCAKVSAGSDGVGDGSTRLSDCSQITEFDIS